MKGKDDYGTKYVKNKKKRRSKRIRDEENNYAVLLHPRVPRPGGRIEPKETNVQIKICRKNK